MSWASRQICRIKDKAFGGGPCTNCNSPKNDQINMNTAKSPEEIAAIEKKDAEEKAAKKAAEAMAEAARKADMQKALQEIDRENAWFRKINEQQEYVIRNCDEIKKKLEDANTHFTTDFDFSGLDDVKTSQEKKASIISDLLYYYRNQEATCEHSSVNQNFVIRKRNNEAELLRLQELHDGAENFVDPIDYFATKTIEQPLTTARDNKEFLTIYSYEL